MESFAGGGSVRKNDRQARGEAPFARPRWPWEHAASRGRPTLPSHAGCVCGRPSKRPAAAAHGPYDARADARQPRPVPAATGVTE